MLALPMMAFGVGCRSGGARSDTDIAEASGVRVEAEGCQVGPAVGAGSYVAPGRVLTVAHVVAGSTEVDVVQQDGTEHQAIVVALDRKKDLALLSVASSNIAPLEVGNMRSGTRGVLVVWRHGKPLPIAFIAKSVVDINAADIDNGSSTLRRGYRIDAHIEPGDSGSVLVAKGAAVAVVFARSTAQPDHAWATDIAEAAPLISHAGDTEVDTGHCP